MTVDESLIRSRVAARQAANELTELYTAESARIKDAHGLEAAIVFLETLRDNLISIRPLPPVDELPEPKPAPVKSKQRGSRGWDDRDIPERYVLIEFDDECEAETDKAVKIGEHWIPKSQLLEVPEVGEYVAEWPVTEWFVEKEGLQ